MGRKRKEDDIFADYVRTRKSLTPGNGSDPEASVVPILDDREDLVQASQRALKKPGPLGPVPPIHVESQADRLLGDHPIEKIIAGIFARYKDWGGSKDDFMQAVGRFLVQELEVSPDDIRSQIERGLAELESEPEFSLEISGELGTAFISVYATHIIVEGSRNTEQGPITDRWYVEGPTLSKPLRNNISSSSDYRLLRKLAEAAKKGRAVSAEKLTEEVEGTLLPDKMNYFNDKFANIPVMIIHEVMVTGENDQGQPSYKLVAEEKHHTLSLAEQMLARQSTKAKT